MPVASFPEEGRRTFQGAERFIYLGPHLGYGDAKVI